MGDRRSGRALWTQISRRGFQWPARVWIADSTLTVKPLWQSGKPRTVDLRGAKLERWMFGVNLVLADDEIRFTVPSRRLARLLLAHGATEFGQNDRQADLIVPISVIRNGDSGVEHPSGIVRRNIMVRLVA